MKKNIKKISKKELDILLLLFDDYFDREIAKILFVAESTLKSRLSSIYKKLNVKNRAEAVRVAIEKGLIRK